MFFPSPVPMMYPNNGAVPQMQPASSSSSSSQYVNQPSASPSMDSMKSGEFNDTKSVSDFEDDGDISVNDSEISFSHHQSDNESTSIPPTRTSTTTATSLSQVEPHDYSMKRSSSESAPAIRVKSDEELTGKLNNMADDLLNMSNGSLSSSSKRKRKSQNPIKCTNSALDLLIEAKMMKLSGEQLERQIGGSRDESLTTADDDDVAAEVENNEHENFTLDLSKNSPSETTSQPREESSSSSSAEEAIDLRSTSPPKNSDPKDDDEEINNNLLAAKKMFGPKYPPFNFLINSILSKPSANQTSDGESESDVSSTNENEDNRYFPENGSFISVF